MPPYTTQTCALTIVGGLAFLHASFVSASFPVRQRQQSAQAFRFFTPKQDAVMLGYINHRWYKNRPWMVGDGGWPTIPFGYFLRGRKSVVEFSLGDLLYPSAPGEEKEEEKELGEGRLAYVRQGDAYAAHFYKDREGTRLILFDGPYGGIQEAILSRVSEHSAALVSRDLTTLRSGPGVGLGDTKHQILNNMGRPSETDRFRDYELLLYLESPKEREEYKEGHAKAIVLARGRVVEIWLYIFSNAPVP